MLCQRDWSTTLSTRYPTYFFVIQLGYGSSDIVTLVRPVQSSTTYCRTTFTVDDANRYSSGALSLTFNDGTSCFGSRHRVDCVEASPAVAAAFYDTGVVVYVNGIEVGRSNVATGQLSYTAHAKSELGVMAAGVPVVFPLPVSVITTGVNILAVEVHASASISSIGLSGEAVLAGVGSLPTPMLVTRGPYLQLGTSTSMSIRFRAGSATGGR